MSKNLIIHNLIKRSFSINSPKRKLNHVTVIGSGLMGSGIAQVTGKKVFDPFLILIGPNKHLNSNLSSSWF